MMYQNKVLSSQGRQPNLTPLSKNCIDLGPYPWLSVDSVQPLMADLPVKVGFLKPNHLATIEFTPSQPIKTFHPQIGTKNFDTCQTQELSNTIYNRFTITIFFNNILHNC